MFNLFLQEFYFVGYKGGKFPRYMRKLFARTPMHRAWIAGKLGIFTDVETKTKNGICGAI